MPSCGSRVSSCRCLRAARSHKTPASGGAAAACRSARHSASSWKAASRSDGAKAWNCGSHDGSRVAQALASRNRRERRVQGELGIVSTSQFV